MLGGFAAHQVGDGQGEHAGEQVRQWVYSAIDGVGMGIAMTVVMLGGLFKARRVGWLWER